MASSLIPLITAALLFVPSSFALASTSPAASRQHFVLVHGLGHGAWCWYRVIALLEATGNGVTALDLASNGVNKEVADTVTSLSQFARPLAEFMANNVTAAEKVILVGHSLGGGIISYAMELFPDKISKAIFLTAIMPRTGQSFTSSFPITTFSGDMVLIPNFANGPSAPATSVALNLTLAKYYLYNRSPAMDVNLAYVLLNPSPSGPTREILTLTATNYGRIRRFYIRTGLDKANSPSIQQDIIKANPPERVFELPKSDHSAFFSQPSALVKLLYLISSL